MEGRSTKYCTCTTLSEANPVPGWNLWYRGRVYHRSYKCNDLSHNPLVTQRVRIKVKGGNKSDGGLLQIKERANEGMERKIDARTWRVAEPIITHHCRISSTLHWMGFQRLKLGAQEKLIPRGNSQGRSAPHKAIDGVVRYTLGIEKFDCCSIHAC